MGKKMKPLLLTSEQIAEFSNTHNPIIVDVYGEIIDDLFLIRNPRFKFEKEFTKEQNEFKELHKNGKNLIDCGTWFYFPWNNQLVHFLDNELHQELRTARNRNLITTDEQAKLRGVTVAIAGMSVGSHCALTLNMMGISSHMKIADPDTLSGSNMNRVRYDYSKVGQKKTAIAREYMYQMDPYSNIDEFSDGVTAQNIDTFLEGVDILVEETDHLETKIFLREEAKRRGIPVVMATDNGDGVIVDIERFDLDKNTKLFNGLIGDITLEEFKTFPPTKLPELATKIAGADMILPRMLSSLQEVGKTLYSWPQLGDAATLSGVAVAFVVKQMVLGVPIRSGKIDINLEHIFKP